MGGAGRNLNPVSKKDFAKKETAASFLSGNGKERIVSYVEAEVITNGAGEYVETAVGGERVRAFIPPVLSL